MPRPLFQYACIATDGTGGRCRENAIVMDGVPSFFCREHMAEGAEVKLPPFADTVVVKFTIRKGGDLHKRLLAAGIPEIVRDPEKSEEHWVEFARTVGRDPYAVRAIQADAGVQVFGKDGLGNVDAAGLREELERVAIPTAAGEKHYAIAGAHIYKRPERPDLPVFAVAFQLGASQMGLTARQDSLISEVFAMTWPYLHAWVNPPDPKKAGAVMHTANFAGKPSNNPSTFSIKFVEGQFAGSWYPEYPEVK